MKILSTNFNHIVTEKNKITSRPVFDVPKDTFIKSSLSFKGAEQKAAVQGAKTLMELGAFTAVVFTAFKKLTGGSGDINDVNLENIDNPFVDFVKNIIGQKDAKISELEEENSRLKQENDKLKGGVANSGVNTEAEVETTTDKDSESKTKEAVKTDNAISEEPADEEISEAAEENGTDKPIQSDEAEVVQNVKFPSKRGIMSPEQKILKAEVIKIGISPEYNEKLTAICQDILKKGAKDKENKQRMLDLSAELRECCGDKEKLKAVVDKYGEGIVIPQTQEAANPETQEDGAAGQKPAGKEQTGNNNGANELYDRVADRTLPGTTVVGSIDLSTIPGAKGKYQRMQRGCISGTSIPINGSDGTKNAASGQPAPLEIFSGDVATSGTYIYNKPGTVPLDAKRNLTDALVFFEKQYLAETKRAAKEKGKKPEYIKWMARGPVCRVAEKDITNEVDKCKDKGKLSKYYNINRNNAETVVIAINEEKRFRELFTFHGATRFVERLVDFNSDEPIEEQASRGIRLMEEALQKALKAGVPMEVHDDEYIYKDDAGVLHKEMHKGTNIIIPPEYFSEEAKHMFGSYPLKLGICREGIRSKKALICTVYAKGVY